MNKSFLTLKDIFGYLDFIKNFCEYADCLTCPFGGTEKNDPICMITGDKGKLPSEWNIDGNGVIYE